MAAAEGELAPEVQLFNPDGQQVCSTWQYADQTLNLQCELEDAGRYTLLAGSHDSIGQYSLYLQRANNPANSTAIEFDETVSGTVANTVARTTYTFEAAEGDQVVIRMANTEGELAPEAQLFSPDGQQVCSTWQYADQTLDLQCQLEDAGQYTLLVGGYQSSGQYSLSLKRLN
jgi:hypothetical protein